MNDTGGSFYDNFGSHEAPKQPKEREPGWQANRENMSDPYVSKDLPRHVIESMQTAQENHSDAAYWRLFTSQMPKDTFKNSVNSRFGGREAIGVDFRGNKPVYINLYKSLMG